MDEGQVQLPRGPHGLPRDQVAAVQRRRMLDALAAVVAAKGYGGATITAIAKQAGVSLSTFYAQFPNKEEAFLAGAEDVAERLNASLVANATEAPTPQAAIDATLTGIVAFWREHPAEATAYLVEIRAAGPEALERRAALNRQFSQAIQALVGQWVGALDERPRSPDAQTLPVAADALVALTAEFLSEAVRTQADLDVALQALKTSSRLLLGVR